MYGARSSSASMSQRTGSAPAACTAASWARLRISPHTPCPDCESRRSRWSAIFPCPPAIATSITDNVLDAAATIETDAAVRDNPAPVDTASPRDRVSRAARPSRRLEVARRARGGAVGALDHQSGARPPRGPGPPPPPAHLRRPRADRPRLPGVRRRPARERRAPRGR